MTTSARPFQTDDSKLHAVHEKVLHAEPLSEQDIVALYASSDILGIGWLANYAREQAVGNQTLYSVGTITEGKGAGTSGDVAILGEDVSRVLKSAEALKGKSTQRRVSAWTMEQLASDKNPSTVLQQLRDAGITSLIGGAVLFHPAVKRAIWKNASPHDRRAEVLAMATAAGFDVPLYVVQRGFGAEAQAREIVSLCGLQASSFSVLSFDPDAITSRDIAVTTGMQEMRQIAVARLVLPKVQHIRTYWQMLGGKLVQIGLRFGASEVDGTSLDPQDDHEARAKELAREITVAGREPLEVQLAPLVALMS